MHLVIFWAVSFIWGSSFILMKFARLAFGPLTVSGGRVLAGFLVLSIIWYRHKNLKPIARSRFPKLLLVALSGFVIPFSLQPYLVIVTDNSGFIGMMVAFTPLMTILVSIPLLKRYPSRRELVSVVGGLVCMVILMYDGLDKEISGIHILLALVAPVLYAVSNTLVKKEFSDVHPLVLSCSAMAISSLLLLPLGLIKEPIQVDTHFTQAIGSLLLLGFVGTGIAISLFYHLIQVKGPLFAGMITYVIPCVAVSLSAILGEEVSLRQIIALSITLALVYFLQTEKKPARD